MSLAVRLTVCAGLALSAAGCPRLPPPVPRPSVALERIARAGSSLRAHLRVHNRGDAALRLTAVDWELVLAGRPLARGRTRGGRSLAPGAHAALIVELAIPAPLEGELRRAAAQRRAVELRGTVHLEDAGGRGRPAPFDEVAALP
jgi:hypothetical protein